MAWSTAFLSWAAGPDTVEQVLEHEPAAVMLSFGTRAELSEPVQQSPAKLILQVTSLDEAREAVGLGADLIVAQGTEAGGHGARAGRSTLPFVPAVVDLVAPVPVLAAGGIADGRGLAAALVLGASGALVGARFQATQEAVVDPAIKKAIVGGRGGETERSSVLDIVSGSRWPRRYTGRTLPRPAAAATLGRGVGGPDQRPAARRRGGGHPGPRSRAGASRLPVSGPDAPARRR